MSARHLLLGLAPPRAAWFTDLARAATSGLVPVEFVKCVSVAELRARLVDGRPWSAVLLDGHAPGLDRDLLADVTAVGVPSLVVDGDAPRRWQDLGATAVLAPPLDPASLSEALRRHGRAAASPAGPSEPPPVDPRDDREGLVVAVTGVPGAGRSTVAAGLAQHLAATGAAAVVLADLCLRADQAVLHGVGDVIPGLPELVDAHRLGRPGPEEVARLLFAIDERGYRLLLGLRRHRDWATLRSRSLGHAVAGLRRCHDVVVADVDADVEGEAETGSRDVEDRNVLARTTLDQADVVAVVGLPTLAGLHGLVRVVHELLAFGVPGDRILPVVNRAPRSPRGRAELSRAVTDLVARHTGPAVLVPELRRIEACHRDRLALPAALGSALATAVDAVGAAGPRHPTGTHTAAGAPVAVVPGALGHWGEAEAG